MPKTKALAKPPTEAAIAARQLSFTRQHWDHEKAVRAMWLARLQQVLVTPQRIQEETSAVAALFKECLTLGPDDLSEIQRLHQRLAKVVADQLWQSGTIELPRAQVLNALAAMLHTTDNCHTLPWSDEKAGTK